MLRSRLRSILTSLLAVATIVVASASPSPAETPARDALQRKVRAQLSSFATWLERNDARGYLGEIGWPDDYQGDGAEWNRLAADWFSLARNEGLWVSGWATGEWWGDDYHLSMYEDRGRLNGVDSANTQAPVFEAAAGDATRIGLTVNGGEFGSPITKQRSPFSNENPGAYQTKYHYDRAATFEYLAGKGVGHVRIPFRWERIQPRLGGPLDDKEVSRLKEVVGRASAAGLPVILDMHNYGAYYLSNGEEGVRRAIGSAQLSVDDFGDAWGRISRAFGDVAGVKGYALMAEPFGMPRVGGTSPARLWERASQRALSAIRATGDERLVSVAGYGWDALQTFMRNHPTAWIEDPADNFLYEVHHYWDRDYSGDYSYSYASEVRKAEQQGW